MALGRRYLRVTHDLEIFFGEDGKAHLVSKSKIAPEDVELAVCLWQKRNQDHPAYEFSERWLRAFEVPNRHRADLQEKLGQPSEEVARKLWMKSFRSIRDCAKSLGASEDEAKAVALKILENIRRDHQQRRDLNLNALDDTLRRLTGRTD